MSETVDATVAQRLMMLVSAVATIAMLLDNHGRNIFDLATAYGLRHDAADAMRKGEASLSSIWFQVAFVCYPAAYVFTALHLLYAPRIQPAALVLFGAVPFVLAGMVMGGRMPILYGLLLAWLAQRQRQRRFSAEKQVRASAWRRRISVIATVLAGIVALYYFAAIFLVRAEEHGGAAAMFAVAQDQWGIAFVGPMANTMFQFLGQEISYLIFVFAWYLVQGLVIGNQLLFEYADAPQWGAYGIDLMSALLRRLNPDRLTHGFDVLMDIGAYGFFPSAWGSLFVDLRYGSALASAAWGAIAGLTYRRVITEKRLDWMLAGPFVSIGILCSTINTPLGFANGMVAHFWLVVAFLALQRSTAVRLAVVSATDDAAP